MPRRGRDASKNSANRRSTRLAGQRQFSGVFAGQWFGVYRSGGPKVGSSNLPSPTTESCFGTSSRLLLKDFNNELQRWSGAAN